MKLLRKLIAASFVLLHFCVQCKGVFFVFLIRCHFLLCVHVSAVGLIHSNKYTQDFDSEVPFAVISLNEWSLIKLIDFGCYQLVEMKPKRHQGRNEFTCFWIKWEFGNFFFLPLLLPLYFSLSLFPLWMHTVCESYEGVGITIIPLLLAVSFVRLRSWFPHEKFVSSRKERFSYVEAITAGIHLIIIMFERTISS